jgi:glutamate N-acetyltransferase/amino-acid N-acetyltransferase
VEAAKNTKNVTVNRGPFEVPGFLAGATESGMRYSGRPDLALIYAPNPAGCAASGVFTRNSFRAAPVELCRERLEKRSARAILVNAGIANACTGLEGKNRAVEMARIAADALGCPGDSVLVSSTGVIGMQVEVAPVARCMPLQR